MRTLYKKELEIRDAAVKKKTGFDYMTCFVAMSGCAVVAENIRTIKPQELVDAFSKLDKDTFGVSKDPKFNLFQTLTSAQLGLMLEVFGIYSEPILFESGVEKGYYCSDITRVASNFTSIPLPI